MGTGANPECAEYLHCQPGRRCRSSEQTEQGGVSSHCLEEANKIAFHQGMPLKLHVEHTGIFALLL